MNDSYGPKSDLPISESLFEEILTPDTPKNPKDIYKELSVSTPEEVGYEENISTKYIKYDCYVVLILLILLIIIMIYQIYVYNKYIKTVQSNNNCINQSTEGYETELTEEDKNDSEYIIEESKDKKFKTLYDKNKDKLKYTFDEQIISINESEKIKKDLTSVVKIPENNDTKPYETESRIKLEAHNYEDQIVGFKVDTDLAADINDKVNEL